MQPRRYFAGRGFRSIRPSRRASARPISSMPANCRGSSRSSRTSAPSRIAVTGIRNVTSRRLVGPVTARIRKYRTYARCSRQEREASKRGPRDARRKNRQGPGAVDEEHDRQNQHGACRDLPRGRIERRHTHALELAPIDTREGVGERRPEAGELSRRALFRHQQRWSHQHGDAAEADQQCAKLQPANPFVLREEMGNHQGEQRRGCIQDRGKAGRDLRLAPEDQAEGHEIVE